MIISIHGIQTQIIILLKAKKSGFFYFDELAAGNYRIQAPPTAGAFRRK